MPPDDPRDLPGGARRLLLGAVDSFEKLEVLLALHAAPAPLRLGTIAARTGLSAVEVEAAAAALANAALVEHLTDGTWRVPPPGSPERAAVAELAAGWAASRPAVLKIMTQRALERVRAGAARAFADAFRLRQRDDDDGDDHG